MYLLSREKEGLELALADQKQKENHLVHRINNQQEDLMRHTGTSTGTDTGRGKSKCRGTGTGTGKGTASGTGTGTGTSTIVQT